MPERRNYAEETLNKLNLNITFFDAVKPENLSLYEYNILSETYNPSNKLMYKKMTKLPVHLSYTMCFLDALQKGFKTIIIFEDDIIIEVSKKILIDSIQEFLNSYFIMFYMGYCWIHPTTCNKNRFDTTSFDYLVEPYSKTLFCNHAILFKMEYIPELLDFIYPMDNYSDDMFSHFFRKKGYKICVPRTPYFNQNRKTLNSLNENEDLNLPTCNFKT